VWVPGHPVANSDGYALEHRYVLHEAGVELPQGRHVHHLNEDKTDNRIENLVVLTPLEHVGGPRKTTEEPLAPLHATGKGD
jgi:hypothetical protein